MSSQEVMASVPNMALSVRPTNSAISQPESALPIEPWAAPASDGQRGQTFMVTWSHTELPVLRSPNSASRAQFAQILAECLRAARAPKHNSISVFQEYHKNGMPHFHAILDLSARCRLGASLGTALLRGHNIKADIAVVTGKGGMARALEYCAVPSPSKLVVDWEPYLSDSNVLLGAITDKAAKAHKRLTTSAAGNHEVYEYLIGRPDILNYEQLCADTVAPGGCQVRKGRVSRFISRQILQAEAIVTANYIPGALRVATFQDRCSMALPTNRHACRFPPKSAVK